MPAVALRVAAKAAYDFFSTLKEKGLLFEAQWQKETSAHPLLGDMYQFIGFPQIKQLEEKYLPQEELEKYKDSIGFQP
ncbi:MAG: hypothetical protein GX996_07690 [Firmicutes bacterium]|nr:hypothetical protein [Bacillota bacterium]